MWPIKLVRHSHAAFATWAAATGKWLFVLAAIPLSLFALIGIEYGAFFPYATGATICIFQVFYPTLFVWGLIFALFAAALVAYGFILATDAARIAVGVKAEVFLNFYDTIAFLLLFAIIFVVFVGLLYLRPTLLQPTSHKPE